MTLTPNDPPITVRHPPEFKRSLKHLSRKYRHIRSDVQPVIDEIAKGNFIGDHVTDIGEKEQGEPYVVRKVRIANTDSQKGKSGGYRLLYWVQSPTSITLIALYSKGDQGNLYSWEIRAILEGLRR